MKTIFKHGDTVRLVGIGTPSQRSCLWVVDASRWPSGCDTTSSVRIYRQDDPDCWIYVPRGRLVQATVLDLLVAATADNVPR